ncbi:hypothetical protein GCM10010515_56980 [Streptomyces fructofermentans]|uniref:Lipoprotein n=1 Tax=Streptomyces fructofermentans TaxID=152141 RepID=A0A918NMU6_9ACTN|nr:hypothetical protein GCM10010515_56980 [Streptomyces fructofermentans]
MLTVAAAVVSVMSLALTACAQNDSGVGSGDREAAYKRVVNDPHASPDAVIEAAGAPAGVARAGDGSLLLSYNARSIGDDEGPAAAAWRIVSPAGRTVAQQAWHANVEDQPDQYIGVRDGFVRWHRSSRVRRARTRSTYAASGTRSPRRTARWAPTRATSSSTRGCRLASTAPPTAPWRPRSAHRNT